MIVNAGTDYIKMKQRIAELEAALAQAPVVPDKRPLNGIIRSTAHLNKILGWNDCVDEMLKDADNDL